MTNLLNSILSNALKLVLLLLALMMSSPEVVECRPQRRGAVEGDGHKFLIHPRTLRIVDGDGREVYFHGANKFMGPAPTMDRFSKEEIKRTGDLGMNVIRLAIDWHGLEPVRGQYNMTYVQLIHTILREMDSLGMYALIDAHQDCLSPKFCGDGVPDWAANPRANAAPFPEPIDRPYVINNATGYPNREDCSKHYWGFYCLSEAGSSAIQNFYDNHEGALDSFSAWWQFLAYQFKNYTNILGYELLNEPFAGDVYSRPSLFLPSVADNENLMPMYHKVSEAIRRVDPDTLIFFEPVTWSDLGSGFKTVPGGDRFQNKSVLSYHFYVPPNTLINDYLPMREKDAANLRSGSMLTEFDVIDHDEANMKQIRGTIEACYKRHVSWIGWTYTGFLDNDNVVSLLSQTYAQKVAGSVIEQEFDVSNTKDYLLRYRTCSSCTQPTVIFLNEQIHYPDGYTVDISPANSTKWRRTRANYIEIVPTSSLEETITIKITKTTAKP